MGGLKGELLPGTRKLGLVHKLEAGGKLENTPGLKFVGAGADDVAGLAAVAAESFVEPTAALLRGE